MQRGLKRKSLEAKEDPAGDNDPSRSDDFAGRDDDGKEPIEPAEEEAAEEEEKNEGGEDEDEDEPDAGPEYANAEANEHLLDAIRAGNVGEIKRLLAQGDFKKTNDFTPLQLAAESGQLEIARLLIGAGTEPDVAHYEFGVTPLHSAALGNHAEIARLVLSANYPSSTPDRVGLHPIHFAASRANTEVMRVLLQEGRVSVDQRQDDPNWGPEDGRTPLIIVVGNIREQEDKRAFECIRMLLDAGADPTLTAPTEEGDQRASPIDMAKSRNLTQVLKILAEPQKLK